MDDVIVGSAYRFGLIMEDIAVDEVHRHALLHTQSHGLDQGVLRRDGHDAGDLVQLRIEILVRHHRNVRQALHPFAHRLFQGGRKLHRDGVRPHLEKRRAYQLRETQPGMEGRHRVHIAEFDERCFGCTLRIGTHRHH